MILEQPESEGNLRSGYSSNHQDQSITVISVLVEKLVSQPIRELCEQKRPCPKVRFMVKKGDHKGRTLRKPVGAGLVPALLRDGFISFGIKNIPEYCYQ